jgi:spore coat protein U-like protein
MQYNYWKAKNGHLALCIYGVVCLSAFSLNTLAATDGSLGSTSEGTSVVTIIKEDAVLITDVDDLNLGTRGALLENQVATDGVCVYTSTGSYSLSITSANGLFSLKSETTQTDIGYSLNWITDTTTSVVYNSPIVGLIGDGRSITCNATTNALFQLTITPSAFNAADPGNYQDTLTLLVAPE